MRSLNASTDPPVVIKAYKEPSICSSPSVYLDCRDSIIYSAFCDRIGDAPVAIKVYNKARLSTSKLRAIKREAAMMIYMSRKK